MRLFWRLCHISFWIVLAIIALGRRAAIAYLPSTVQHGFRPALDRCPSGRRRSLCGRHAGRRSGPEYLGTDPGKALFWSAAFVTTLSMLAAANVVARESWTAMAAMVFVLSAVPPIVVIVAASSQGWAGMRHLGGVLLGGFIAFAHLYRTFRGGKTSDSINRMPAHRS
jgi:hypothetical protein